MASSDSKFQSASGMLLDGIFGSEAIDSSGEILDVEGADISDLEEGRGVFNWEHRGEDANGASPNDIVGKIIYAKKIFKRSDCETERERSYWDQVKMPFIYGVGRLYDAAGHPGAMSLAAQIRDHHKNNEPILVRFSVEGSTLEKKNNRLLRSVIRRVALTLKPCNKTANSGLLADPNAPAGFEKKPESGFRDLLDLETKKFEHPNFARLGSSFETEYSPLHAEGLTKNAQELSALVKSLAKLKTLEKINKAIAAGTGAGVAAPSALASDEALKKMKSGFMAAIRDFNSPFEKAEFKQFLKYYLPECDDEYLDRFADLAEDLKLKKSSDEPSVVKSILKSQFLSVELNKAASELNAPPPRWAIDVSKHALSGAGLEPEQHELAINADLSDVDPLSTTWIKLKNGKAAYVKSDWSDVNFNKAKKEAAFYSAAKNVFRLSHYLPVSVGIKNPNGDIDHVVTEAVPNADHVCVDRDGKLAENQAQIIKELGDSGELDKMLIMDMVMGNHDRHHMNMVFCHDSDCKLKLLGHDLLDGMAMSESPHKIRLPAYMEEYCKLTGNDWNNSPFHAAAAKWIKSVNLKKLENVLQISGVPKQYAEEAVRRLLAAKNYLRKNVAKATRGGVFWSSFENNKA